MEEEVAMVRGTMIKVKKRCIGIEVITSASGHSAV
jgi:hypothetical protein